MKDKQKKSLKMKRIWWTIKFVLPMFLLTLVFFSINGEKAISAPARWEDDFNDCPQQDLTNFPGQNCLAGQGICGVDTTGVDLAQCYSKASMNYPTASTTSSTVYASGEDGGYVVNCYVDMDATAPYCDNSGTWWCNRDATCNAQNRETECIGGGTAFSCEDCYSGYYDCTGDATCEIRSGVTACPDAHGTYNTTCGCNCSAYWYNCDGDATTCEWGGTNVDNENYRFTSACATSSFECLPGYDDCNADLNEANINADTTDGCEIDEWDTNFGAAGLNNRYNDSCTVICDANYYDCDGFGATTTNGCEVQNAASCTVGQLSGTWDGPNCNCVVPTSYFETGVMAEFATTSPLLWGYQYGTGPLMQFTSWGASSTGGIFYVGNDGKVGIGTSSPGSMLTVGMDSGNQFLVNSTGVVTAGTWNGSIIDVAYGGTGTSTFEANSLLFASSDNNISEVLIGLEGYSLAVVGGKPTWVASSTGAAHPLLSVSHADTSEEAVLRGALIVGRQNASLEWARLTLGSNGYILYSDGTDAIWQSFENLWDINMLATTSMPHITDLGGLATVGTITSGIWNGSTIDVAHGGTGLTSVSGGYLLVGNSASALQATSSIFVADSGFVGIGTTTPQYNTVIIGTTSVDTICLGGSCIADWGQSGAIDGSGSTNYVTYWQDGNTLTSEAQLANTRGGTGQNSSGWTGIAAINGGTWSASTSIQNVYIADDLTVTGGVIGSNNISGTLTTTNTLTIGDDGDNIIISASNWDVNASGQITAGTDETINGIDISGGVISDVTGLTVNGNIIVSGFVDGVDISAASSTWDAKQDAITGAATTVLTSDLTADRALISNGSGKIAVSGTISSTELGYLDNVSSSIQTQLNSKWDELSDMALTQGYIFVGDSNDDPKATSSIFITSIGNVGIGSTSPMYDFVVVGTSSADTICLDGSCISNWGESGAISGSGNTGYAAYWSNATTLAGEQYLATSRGGTNQNSSGWNGVVNVVGGTWSTITGTANNITYWSDANTIKATTSIYLADSSFAGIGTSSPINQLDVRGNLGVLNQNELRFYEQEGSGHNYVAFKASTTLGSNFTWILPTTAGADGEALMMGSNNKLEWGTPVGAGTNESSTAGYITYYKTGGTTVSGTSTIFIAPNGYVGIGSGTPNNLLSIGDNININAAGTITGGTWQGAPVGLTYGGLGGNFNSSTGYLYVAGGTTIATSTIYIGNTDLNAGTGLTLSGNTINLDEFTMGTTDTDATLGSIFFAGTGGAMQQDNANLFWDDTNNRLGIGSSSPQQTLTIQGVVGQGILNIASSTGESIFFVNEYDNIGIGTISPSEKLVLNNGNFLQTEGTPIKLGGVNLGDDGRGLWIKDNYAYVVSANYLSVVDITNPSHPIFIASTTIGTGVSAYGIRISGTYAYVVGGSASDDDIHIFDKYLYLGSLKTGGFEIYDISDPLNAVRLGGTSVTANDAIKSIWVVNNKAYVVSNSNSYNLEVFNVSDPTNPTLLDGLNTSSGNGADIYVSGRYAYFGTESTGNDFHIIDISSSTNMTVVSELNTTGSIRGIWVAGNYAYTSLSTGGNKVEIFDIASSTNPSSIGSLATADYAWDIVVNGKYAYVVSGPIGDDLEIFDITGISAPAANIGNIATNYINVSENAYIDNNLYIGNGLNVGVGGIKSDGSFSAYGDGYFGGNLTVGTTTFGAMLTVGATSSSQFLVDSNGRITDGTWQGDAVGLTYGGLGGNFNSATGFFYVSGGVVVASSTIYIGNTDLNAGTGLTLSGNTINLDEFTMGTTDTDATLGSIFFAGTGGAMQQDNANLFWDDTNNRLGIGTTTPFYTLTVEGTVGNGILNIASSSGNSYVQIDKNGLTTFTGGVINPRRVGYIQSSNIDNANGIYVVKDYAYVSGKSGISIFNVASSSNTIFIASTSQTWSTISSPRKPVVVGNYAYLPSDGVTTGAVSIFEVSNPAAPMLVGRYPDYVTGATSMIAGAKGIAISGKYLYVVAAGRDTFAALDISDPSDPKMISEYRTNIGDPQNVIVDGSHAYIANCNANALTIMDISDPFNLVRDAHLVDATRLDCLNGIDKKGNYIYGSVWDTGRFTVIDVSNPKNPYIATSTTGPTGTEFTNGNDVVVEGDYAYVIASNKIVIMNIKDPINPRYITEIGIVSAEIFLSGRYLYAVSGSDEKY